MNRRAVLGSVGTLISASAAGCVLGRSEPEPTFTIRNVRSYRADGRTAFGLVTVEKRGDAAGTVEIRAELLMEDTYDHADWQSFVIEEDFDERELALPFTYDTDFLDEQPFTARAKIVRHGEADGHWVSETE